MKSLVILIGMMAPQHQFLETHDKIIFENTVMVCQSDRPNMSVESRIEPLELLYKDFFKPECENLLYYGDAVPDENISKEPIFDDNLRVIPNAYNSLKECMDTGIGIIQNLITRLNANNPPKPIRVIDICAKRNIKTVNETTREMLIQSLLSTKSGKASSI